MKKITKLLSAFLSVVMFSQFTVLPGFAEELNKDNESQNDSDTFAYSAVNLGIDYLESNRDEYGIWSTLSDGATSDVINTIELLDKLGISKTKTVERIAASVGYLDMLYSENINDLSCILIVNSMQNDADITCLKENQNSDGGFGLAKGYTSDIIDTKLALKALTDIGETDAMTNAALYISALQNEDGGFGYQQGLSSNAYLSADIANILVDTIDVNPVLSYYLKDTFTALDSYLDTAFPAINELSASDLDTVYQRFYTALYRLKRDGRYDVSPYYALQAEDGGVFNDPMATALYLELLVREQNALVAKIDNIAITNDKGYAVSAFNSNENVNISVINEFETNKSHFEMSIIKPDGTAIPLDGDTAVWNTAENPDGEYTVRAEIIRNSNNEVAKSLEQTFRIQHRLAVDSITLTLSQPYSRVGDTDSVDITAEFDISNYTEDNQLAINWTVTDV